MLRALLTEPDICLYRYGLEWCSDRRQNINGLALHPHLSG